MKLATYNVNGIASRLSNLLQWLEREAPDVVCLQELKAADHLLGARAAQVEIVAVVANPLYRTEPYLAAFDRQERLTGVRNWLYLTGPLTALRKIWAEYGISAVVLPSGQMIGHNDLVFVITRDGLVSQEINSDPGDGTQASKSSFAVVYSQAAQRALAAGPAG